MYSLPEQCLHANLRPGLEAREIGEDFCDGAETALDDIRLAGPDGRTLFITARPAVYAIRMLFGAEGKK